MPWSEDAKAQLEQLDMARSKATCRVSVEAELQQKKVNQIKPARLAYTTIHQH